MNFIKQKDQAMLTAKKIWGRFSRLSLRDRSMVIGAIILVLILIANLSGSDNISESTTSGVREVRVASIAELSSHSLPLSLLGTVTSRNEATIRAEASGKIVGVYKKLGDYAEAGAVIAEFENSTERAQLLQAQGAYEAAKAQQDIASINSGTTGTSLVEAKTQALNTIFSAYGALDDAIRTKTDPAFRNPQTREAKFLITISDAKLVITLEEKRIAIEEMLRARNEINKTLTTNSDLSTQLSTVESEARYIRDYLDDLNLALSRAIADTNASTGTIEGLKVSSGIARNTVSGTLSTVTISRNALSASTGAEQIANKNYNDQGSGSITDAGLKSALGNLRAAESRLAKTIVRSPISGTINSLSIKTGDFISPFTEIAVVSNNGALEVLAYATEDDAASLSVGNSVSLEKNVTGVITRIAPALDPRTKKIEVRIGITSGTGALINGQSVRANIKRINTKTTSSSKDIQIPISALKMTPTGALVFTVNTENLLESHIVTLGALLGNDIVITGGITRDMEIVIDARGLKEGMEVTVTK